MHGVGLQAPETPRRRGQSEHSLRDLVASIGGIAHTLLYLLECQHLRAVYLPPINLTTLPLLLSPLSFFTNLLLGVFPNKPRTKQREEREREREKRE